MIGRLALSPILRLEHSPDLPIVPPMHDFYDEIKNRVSITDLVDILWKPDTFINLSDDPRRRDLSSKRTEINSTFETVIKGELIGTDERNYWINMELIDVEQCRFVYSIADEKTPSAELNLLLTKYEQFCEVAAQNAILLCGLTRYLDYSPEAGNVAWIEEAEARLQEFYLRGIWRLFLAQQNGLIQVPLIEIQTRLVEYRERGVLAENQALLERVCKDVLPEDDDDTGLRIVNTTQNVEFKSIVKAVNDANPNDTLHVFPGTYVGAITIDKPLQIIGISKNKNKIIIQATDTPAITFTTNEGKPGSTKLQGVTVLQEGRNSEATVLIKSGNPLIEECAVRGEGDSCVKVIGEATPHLLNVEIERGRYIGISYCNSAGGTLETSIISHNGYRGVQITSEKGNNRPANPLIQRNSIIDNGDDGVSISLHAQGQLRRNIITGNNCAGISLSTYANPRIYDRNNINNNTSDGIFAERYAIGLIEDNNNIAQNHQSNISIKTHAHLTIVDNIIKRGWNVGIYVHEEGIITLKDNSIIESRTVGIMIKEGSYGTFERNIIEDNGGDGVLIKGGSGATIVGDTNDFAGNSGKNGFNIEPDCDDNITRS